MKRKRYLSLDCLIVNLFALINMSWRKFERDSPKISSMIVFPTTVLIREIVRKIA